ncbi:M23 family metallopeptidase [Aminobacter sp. UC22_36]|uniref:M23 family metallopeptidase n=1 Tax=Aminobacter sp. UC22_36 TaxID=3374549 RepID=UPI0037574F81
MSFVSVALPLAFCWRLWRLDEPSRLGWLLVLAESTVLVILVVIVARWNIAGMWSRVVLVGLFAAAAAVSAWRHLRRPWLPAVGSSIIPGHLTAFASVVVFGTAVAYVMSGIVGRHNPRGFTFPLEAGRFVMAHGGTIGVLNHHSDHPAHRHALDITAVNDSGFRATGLLPAEPARYVIFGKTVLSPCDGTILAAVDGLPDLAPPMTDRDNPAGNHVVVSCGDLNIELAHLRKGSVAVAAGDRIVAGAPIGQVGNSGNSTEPHLHIHAIDARSGTGVQMSFNGAVPVRNTLIAR